MFQVYLEKYYGLPNMILLDNGKQFKNKSREDYYGRVSIKRFYSSSGQPKANEKTKVTNRMILNGIKKKLEDAKGKWVDELHSVLWAYRIMERIPIRETPFILAYEFEAVIPTEIGLPSHRV